MKSFLKKIGRFFKKAWAIILKTLKFCLKIIKTICKKIHLYIKTTLKEKPAQLGSLLVAFTGLLQLAISGIHITALVTLKLTNNIPDAPGYTPGVNSMGIGLYLFFYILFGLVAVFAATRIVNHKTTLFAVATNLVACIFGVIFVLKLTNPDSYTAFHKITSSLIWMAVGIGSYLFAIVFYAKQYFMYRRELKLNATTEIYED